MILCIWVTLWVADSQGYFSVVKMLNIGRNNHICLFISPKQLSRRLGVCMACVQPMGVCVFVHSGMCLNSALCVQKAVSYEDMHLCVHMCSCICRYMCLACQGTWQVRMSSGCAEVEKGREPR